MSNTTATGHTRQRGLGLGSLGLLAALLGRLLLLQLLVAEGCQGAGDLLDLVRLAVLDDLLEVLLGKVDEVGLLGVGGEERGCRVAEGLELALGEWVEDWQGREIDGVVGVASGELDNAGGGVGLAAAADADGAKEILGVGKIGFLLGATETLTLLGLGFAVALGFLRELAGALGLALGDALGLALLVGSGFGFGLGLGFGSLLCLLALYLGVLGGVPGVQDIAVLGLLIVELAAADGGSGGWGLGAGARLLLFIVYKTISRVSLRLL